MTRNGDTGNDHGHVGDEIRTGEDAMSPGDGLRRRDIGLRSLRTVAFTARAMDATKDHQGDPRVARRRSCAARHSQGGAGPGCRRLEHCGIVIEKQGPGTSACRCLAGVIRSLTTSRIFGVPEHVKGGPGYAIAVTPDKLVQSDARVRPNQRTGHEAIEIHQGADHRDPEC